MVTSGFVILGASVVSVLGRFASGEFGSDGGGCCVDVVVVVEVAVSVCGGGVVSLVMIVSCRPMYLSVYSYLCPIGLNSNPILIEKSIAFFSSLLFNYLKQNLDE